MIPRRPPMLPPRMFHSAGHLKPDVGAEDAIDAAAAAAGDDDAAGAVVVAAGAAKVYDGAAYVRCHSLR